MNTKKNNLHKLGYVFDSKSKRYVADNPAVARVIGWRLYDVAAYAKLALYDSDIHWIQTHISSDPLFKTVNDTVQDKRNYGKYVNVFYGRFINAYGIPKQVNKLLIATTNLYNVKDQQENNGYVNPVQHFLCELWLQRQQAWR